MSRTMAPRAKLSKKPTDDLFGKDRRHVRWFEPVLAELAEIFPTKLAQELALRAGRSQRVCEFWISGRSAPDGGAMAALLNSDIGDRVHLALTADCKHAWADNNRAVHEISKLRKQQADAERRLKALEQGIR